VVIETGSGPMTPIGINLPNDTRCADHGSKSVSLASIVGTCDKSLPAVRLEFSWTPMRRPDPAVEQPAGEITITCTGRGAGSGERLAGARRHAEGAMLVARGDTCGLVALYFVADPAMVRFGLIGEADHADLVRAEYEGYARNALSQLRRIREGHHIEEDHMRNRQAIVYWLMAHTAAIETRVRDGRTFYVVVDVEAFHEGVARLLAEIQRIKSEGDYDGAKAFFERYGTYFDPALRDEVVRRVDALGLPSYSGFVMPTLTPIVDEHGEIADDADLVSL
jgi:dipeptidyl-peptidase-3